MRDRRDGDARWRWVGGGGRWGWFALQLQGPEGLLTGPTPRETEGTCFSTGWAAVTLKACSPAAHTRWEMPAWLGTPGPSLTPLLLPVGSPPLPCLRPRGSPKSTPKGTGLQVVTFGAEQGETRLSQSPFALPGRRGKKI